MTAVYPPRSFPLARTVTEIDLDLVLAGARLALAVRAYAHSPNGDRESELANARREVDDLLDARLALQLSA